MFIKYKKLSESAIEPYRANDDDAGFDLFVDSDKDIVIRPHETVMLQTNIAVEIPPCFFGAIYARSGLSTRRGLRPANCVGVIDATYRGSIGVPIHNDMDEERVVIAHERVAQLVITPIPYVTLIEVEELSDTERGANGFGSTGTN